MPTQTLQLQTPLQKLLQSYPNTSFMSTFPPKIFVQPLFTYMIIIAVRLIQRPPNVYSLATLLHKKGISAIHLLPGNFMLPWMSLSSKNNPSTPKIPLRGRKIYKNVIFRFKKNYLLGLNKYSCQSTSTWAIQTTWVFQAFYLLHPHRLIHNMQKKLSYMFTQGGNDLKRN